VEDRREVIVEKLKKIKELAERGIGGEKETAMRMYHDLMEKYSIDESRILEDKEELFWFNYKTELEEELLTQIFYKVTGRLSYKFYGGRYSRRKERGCECTELEAVEIKMLFNFYLEELKKELKAFMLAFMSENKIYPDENTRYHDKVEGKKDLTDEEKRLYKKAAFMGMSMDGKRPPKAMLEDKEG
jgi:hypothetical protein